MSEARIDTDFLAGLQGLQATIEKREHLEARVALDEALGYRVPDRIATLEYVRRFEDDCRRALGIPVPGESWGGIEQYQAEGR